MRKKFLTGFTWLVLVALLLCTAATLVLLRRSERREAERDLRQMAEVLGAVFKPGEDLEQQALYYSSLSGFRVTILSEDGSRAADSELSPPYDVALILDREEIIQASFGNVGFAVRASSAMGHSTMFAAVCVDGYYLRLSGDYGSMVEGFGVVLPALALTLVLVFLVVLPASQWYASTMLRPFGDFSQSLDRVMDGGEKLDPAKYPYEELQRMALSINRLSGEVDEGILHVERERQRLAEILNNMKEGLVMLDWHDDILLINSMACRILQYVPGNPSKNLVYATRDIEVLNAVAEVKKTGTVQHVEFTAVDGKTYEVAVSPSAGGEDGKENGVVLLFSDMADFQSNARIRQEFFQSASHELKTPITSVRGFAEILMSGGVTDDAVRAEYAERILKETRRMTELIEDILMIARMESGELRYEREDVDLYDIVLSCCEDFHSIAEENRVAIHCHGAPCRMYVSPKQMMELVNNLVGNAVKYNHPDGVVDVTLWIEDGSAVLNVFNTGEAIPETQVDRIFERFYRVDFGRSKAVGGTGLGLAIVKHICGVYGAKVSLIPHPGEGNTFQVVFPPSLAAM